MTNAHITSLLNKHFDIALETPDGIKKLRELILSLAMQGKLVPQDPNDQRASELLKEIQAEKAKLIKEGKIKKQEPLPPIKDNEIPYKLPKGWEWVKLDDICTLITDGTHHTPTYLDSGVPFISVKNLSSGILSFEDTKFISKEEHDVLIKRCNPQLNDILLTKVGTTGIAVTVNTEKEFSIFVSVSLLKILPEKVYPFFLENLINSPMVKKYSKEGTEGVGNKNLVLRKIKEFIIPLPPLNEQKRIVSKIDQLMALCDKLETQRDEHNKKRLTIHTASMNKLLTAPDSTTFNLSWNFITKNFDQLYSVTQNVADLKKMILQLAVMGKLVPQDPNDQPASELLKEIQAEKAKLIKEGKIKKQEPLTPIKDSEIPYKLPKGWEWCRLGNISEVSMGQSPDGKSYNDQGIGVPLVNGPVEFGGKEPFAKSLAIKFTTEPTKMCKKGDLLLCVRGSTTGRTNIAGFDSCIGRGVAALRPYIENLYFNYFILCNRQELLDAGTGSTFPNISSDKITGFLFNLPPLNEQKRIVAKIDQLMNLCNDLESYIKDSTEKKKSILNSVLAKI